MIRPYTGGGGSEMKFYSLCIQCDIKKINPKTDKLKICVCFVSAGITKLNTIIYSGW